MRLSYLLLLLFLVPITSYSQLNDEGWTILTPLSTTKIIYVSASDGDDQSGEVYTSAHTEIGSDPFMPSGTIMPFKTIQAAAENADNGEGAWILLKRGDVFFESLVTKSGASENEPFLYTSYGSSNEMPLLKTGANSGVSYCCRSITNFWVVGISFYAHTRNPEDPDYVNGDGSTGFRFYSGETHRTENILIEGCVFKFYLSNVINGPGLLTNIKLRRNVILNNYGTTDQGHSQGLFASNVNGIILEENIFDHNGWYKQSINSDNSKEDGQATMFNHNIYFADNHNVTFSSNSFFRTSSIGTKWTANNGEGSSTGLTLTNNLYYDYEVGVSMGGNESEPPYRFRDIIVSGNVFDQPNVSMQTNRQLGWMMEMNDWDNGVLSNNLLVHQKLSERTNCYGISIIGQNRDLTVRNNILYNLKNSDYIVLGNLKEGNVDFVNSTIQDNELTFPTENERYYVRTHGPVDNSLFSNNTYSNAQDYEEGFRIESDRMNYNEWISSSGESGSDTTPPSYPDPSRSLDTYVTEILGLSSVDEFYDELRNQTMLNWRLEYTAGYINAWIKEGFGINSDTPTIITSTLPGGIVNELYSKNLSAFGGNGTIIWSITAGSLPNGLTLSETGEISGTPTTPGTATFTVTVSDDDGDEASQQYTITIISECTDVIVNAGNDATINSGETVALNATSDNEGTFLWQPSEGLSNVNIASPIANPAVTTTYTVTVTDTNGCTGEDSITITVNPVTDVSMKYGFSPNNDGINDFWEITGIEQYPDNVVQIFNRWGNLVFEIQGYNNSSNFFDGYANKLKSLGASELPDGTYFFKINIHGEHSLSKTEGYLILKR